MSQEFDPSKLKILICGFGSIGRRHFRNFRQLGCEQFSFYRTKQGTLEDQEISEFETYSDLSNALEQQPDIVVISNPSAFHVPIAIEAAKRGCHLFLEKPLSHNLDDCDELLRIVEEKRLITFIGCQFRFHPLFQQLKKTIELGQMATILGARAEWGEHLPNWHPWEDYRKSYAARDDLGGGVILTLIHPLDYLYALFGSVKKVQSSIRSVPALETPCGEDWVDLTLQFDSKVIADVHLDYWQQPAVHQLTIWGEEGKAVLDFNQGTLTFCAPNGELTKHQVPAHFERNDLFLSETKHFLDSVQSKQQTSIPLQDGIEVLKIALAAKHS